MLRLASVTASALLQAGLLAGVLLYRLAGGQALPKAFAGAPDDLRVPLGLTAAWQQHPGCGYEGDAAGYARTSGVVKRLTPAAAAAFLVLANAGSFCTVFLVGPVAQASESLESLRRLERDPLATEAFKELVATAKPAGQLYGLMGLYGKDRTLFRVEATRLSGRTDRVWTPRGCIWVKVAMSELLEEIGW